jgi:hypothetical protein
MTQELKIRTTDIKKIEKRFQSPNVSFIEI